MTLNELQKNCVRSLPPYLTRGDEALLGLLGLNSAAGDAVGMYKKTLYEGAELDEKAFMEALSHCIYFVAVIAHARDVSLESVMKQVVEQTKAVNHRETVLANGVEDCRGKEE